LTLLEMALRWCVHHSALKVMDGNDGVIIGVSSLRQLEGNLRDLEKGPLPEDVVQALDQGRGLSIRVRPRGIGIKLLRKLSLERAIDKRV
jgi:aflatoxin B1 aldehyde reductase